MLRALVNELRSPSAPLFARALQTSAVQQKNDPNKTNAGNDNATLPKEQRKPASRFENSPAEEANESEPSQPEIDGMPEGHRIDPETGKAEPVKESETPYKK